MAKDDAVYQTTARPVDRSLFVIVALGGGTAVAAIKLLLDSETEGSSLPTVLAVLLMVGYALCVTRTERFRLREDQAGDNMYYLGFIYTLISLSVALYQFESGIQASEYIVSSFGISLATTIVGVTSRILLHQMREDPIDVERDARTQLSQTAGKLRAEMTSTITDFNTFRRSMHQSIEEGFREMASAADAVLRHASDEYKAGTDQAIAGLKGSFDTFADESRKLNQVAKRLVGALESLSHRIDGVQAPSDMVERAIAPAVERMNEVVERLLELVERESDRSARLTEGIIQVESVLTTLTRGASEAEGALKRFASDGLREHAEKLRELGDAIRVVADGGARLSALQTEAVGQATRLGEEVLVGLQHSMEALRREEAGLRDSLLEIMQTVTQQHTTLTTQMTQEHAAAVQALVREIEAALETARGQRSALSLEVEAARKANEELLGSLTSLAKLMTDELRRTAPVA